MRCSGRRTGKETWGEGAHEGGWRTRVASRRQPGTFKLRLGGSNGVLACWGARPGPDLDSVESVEEAREVEGRLGAERSSAKSASMSSYDLLQ